LEETRGADPWTVATLRQRIQTLLQAREVAEQHYKVPPKDTGKNGNSSPNMAKGSSKQSHTTTESLFAGAKGASARSKANKCFYCQEGHWADECNKFPTVEARRKLLKGRCFICLRKDHKQSDCKSERVCAHCKAKNHHRSLCPEKFGGQKPKN